jgi:hypothetical protein
MRTLMLAVGTALVAAAAAPNTRRPVRPETAPKAFVDRFSAKAGHLQVRTAMNHLPPPNAAVDFDQGPFITRGLGPRSEHVIYYNFDVQSLVPAPLYVLYRKGASAPLAGQLPIVEALPGDSGYNDFHVLVRVTVPDGYAANTITSAAALRAADYPTERTSVIENAPIVPEGSTAHRRLGGASAELESGWFDGQTVRYFTFVERPLMGTIVPLSPIFVSFSVNPGAPGGGPSSGFRTESGAEQTHNVLATLPADAGYSPLWQVSVYDNVDFDGVHDLATLQQAKILAPNVATVNCPVVEVQPAMTR